MISRLMIKQGKGGNKMAEGIYRITGQFEKEICRYTGAPYCVAIDNASNAMFLALIYSDIHGKTITIPNRTYPSVPCEIIHAGGRVVFYHLPSDTLKGAYQLKGSNVIDSALRFTYNMYERGTFTILSFTGPYKHLKLSKGGAILTDDYIAYSWFKRARFSGRREKDYMDDHLDVLGWNFYMLPEIATRGLLLMKQFYDYSGDPIPQDDKSCRYPDLSKYKIYDTCLNR